ncbi:hypothetical protein UCMB321_2777 [Pseudomonas batumici]|uniref:Uncharacterized protein n=1 Tax=Pseudomonas batumici TaxID=226910 RepID=A0A0C2EXE9_9PSED|nr:hypothetical protein UCMB321_2777 [Pseudomonas batumici]
MGDVSGGDQLLYLSRGYALPIGCLGHSRGICELFRLVPVTAGVQPARVRKEQHPTVCPSCCAIKRRDSFQTLGLLSHMDDDSYMAVGERLFATARRRAVPIHIYDLRHAAPQHNRFQRSGCYFFKPGANQ